MGQVETTFQVFDDIPSLVSHHAALIGVAAKPSDGRSGMIPLTLRHILSYRCRAMQPEGMGRDGGRRRHLASEDGWLLVCHLSGDGPGEKVKDECGSP